MSRSSIVLLTLELTLHLNIQFSGWRITLEEDEVYSVSSRVRLSDRAWEKSLSV